MKAAHAWSSRGNVVASLRVDGEHGRYHCVADEYWGFAGRLFGGYPAALALVAASHEVPGLRPVSMWCRFVEPVKAGPMRIDVETLSVADRATAVRSTIRQDGADALTVSAWFGQRPVGASPRADGPSGHDAGAVEGPAQCPPIPWRQVKNDFDRSFDRRAIDYPLERAHFVERGSSISLWLRPQAGDEPDAAVSAAVDVMCFDLHMTEAAVERPWVSRERSFSYDLAVAWHVVPSAGWRRLTYESIPLDGVAACRAWMWSEDGRPRAAASQQARLGRPPAPAASAAPAVSEEGEEPNGR